jgi:hypothetical protein
MAGEPEELRADELLAERLPCRGEEGLVVEPRAERGDLLGRTPVVLLDRRAERALVRAQQHEGGDHAAHAHGGHLRQRDVLARAADARDGIRPPGVGIALGPTGMRRHQIVGGAGARDDPALLVERNGLHRCRADVQSKRDLHTLPHAPDPTRRSLSLYSGAPRRRANSASARSLPRSRTRSALIDRGARGHPARRAPRGRTESMRLVTESMAPTRESRNLSTWRAVCFDRTMLAETRHIPSPRHVSRARRSIMVWRMGKLTVAMLITLVTLVALPVTSPAQTGAAATLSVLAPPVERVAAGAPDICRRRRHEPRRGRPDQDGRAGLALITFLDGSTVTVLPDAEVTVKQTGSERGNSGIRMLIHAGRVWARVVQAAGRRSSPLSLESNEYTATAHDGLIGAEQSGNGFVCWTRRGELRLTDRSGQTDVVLMPGRRARATFGSTVVPEPFVPSASVLEVRTSGPVLPLLRMPDGRTAAASSRARSR